MVCKCTQTQAVSAARLLPEPGWVCPTVQDRTGQGLSSHPAPSLGSGPSAAPHGPATSTLQRDRRGMCPRQPHAKLRARSDETSLSLQPSDTWPGVLILKEHRRKWDLAPCASSGEPDELGLQYTTKAVRVCNTPASLPSNLWPWLPQLW